MSAHRTIWFFAIVLGVAIAWRVLALRERSTWVHGVALLLAAFGLVVGAKWQFRLEFLPPLAALPSSAADMRAGGLRLPLGFFLGGICAASWCTAMRISVWNTLDALAVGGVATSLVGRIACIASRCCLGVACPTWAGPFCILPPPESDVAQLFGRDRLVVPLPVLFMTGSALVLLMMIRQLANRAASGTPFVMAVALSSTLKAGLELLRGTPRPLAFAVVMPALTGLLGFIALATVVQRRERGRRGESATPETPPAWAGDSPPT